MNELATHSFNWVDYLIIAVITISTLISLMRGFISEAFSLLTWILAVIIAFKFSGQISYLFANLIHTPTLRMVISFIILFLVVLIIGAIINHFLGLIINHTGLSGTNRLLGMIFGFARGLLLIAIFVLFARFTSANKNSWWNNSYFIPYFQDMANWLHSVIPVQVNNVSHYFSPPDDSKGKQ